MVIVQINKHMKKTMLSNIHEEMGGKMVEFAGFYMPLQFEGVNAEHNTVREKVGVFDVSHMGEVWVKGPKAFELVQKITANNVAALVDGQVQYSCLPNNDGGIVDDLLVYRINEETYLLVINAANIEKDWKWISENNTMNADIYNASDEISQLAVQGPLAMELVQKITEEKITDMKYYTFRKVTVSGIKEVIVSTTGYTGSGGCEIYCANEDVEKIYKDLFAHGAEFGLKPIGLAARDTLRLEAGFCLYGNDINDETSPIEAGLGWITKFVDGNDFIHRPYHEQMKADKPKRRLKGFVLEGRGIPRQHYEITDAEGQVIGEVTSGTMSPYTGKAIGMGYVNATHSKLGNDIYIKIRNKLVKAVIVKTPFFS